MRGSRIKIGVLDQARTGLEEDDTLFDAVGGGNDRVVMGDNTLHVATFLERFLFPREMHQQKVSGMSGGERARLLLAKLMLQGANLLLLDEPTNDLDLLTLRVLEEALLEYDGTVVVVTHDRAFLDRVCTGVLGLDGFGDATVFADRQQFEAYQREQEALRATAPPETAPKIVQKDAPATLSYKERKELDALPERIAAVEAEIAAVDAELADPATYHAGGDRAAELGLTQKEKQATLEGLFDRWESLESRS